MSSYGGWDYASHVAVTWNAVEDIGAEERGAVGTVPDKEDRPPMDRCPLVCEHLRLKAYAVLGGEGLKDVRR